MTGQGAEHELGLASTGDEVAWRDLGDATYEVVKTFVTYDSIENTLVFTHRIELWQTDDQLMQVFRDIEDSGDKEDR